MATRKKYFLTLQQTKMVAVGLSALATIIVALALLSFVKTSKGISDFFTFFLICIYMAVFFYMLFYNCILGGWDKERYAALASKLSDNEYTKIYFYPENPYSSENETVRFCNLQKKKGTFYAKLVSNNQRVISISEKDSENKPYAETEISINYFLKNFSF